MSLNNVYKWKNASTVKAQNITAMLQHELSRKKDRYVERLWRSASAAECLNFYTVLAQICVAVSKELNQKHKNVLIIHSMVQLNTGQQNSVRWPW